MEHQHSSIKVLPSEEEPLTLPHFDDETTVQSARPVVPLHEVKEAAQFKRRLLLGGALCLAALIGALTASVIYDNGSQPDPNTSAAIPNSSSAAPSGYVSPSGEATGAEVDPESAVEPGSEAKAVNESSEEAEAKPNRSSVRQPRTQILRARNQPERISRQAEVQNSSEEDALAQQETLWQQRREARRLRRERRVNGRRTTDELTRIREIFEGTPRP